MTEKDEQICNGILKIIEQKGPVGWYGIEHRLAIPRSEFPDSQNVMSYIARLELTGKIVKNEDGKYVIVS